MIRLSCQIGHKGIYVANKNEEVLKGVYPKNNHRNEKTEAGKDYCGISSQNPA
jgi:hypothetical protein